MDDVEAEFEDRFARLSEQMDRLVSDRGALEVDLMHALALLAREFPGSRIRWAEIYDEDCPWGRVPKVVSRKFLVRIALPTGAVEWAVSPGCEWMFEGVPAWEKDVPPAVDAALQRRRLEAAIVLADARRDG